MAYSTCCGAETDMTEIDICPDCLEHCDWENEEDEETSQDELEQDRQNEIALEQQQINKHEN
jgi:hypothetical protein